MAPVPRCPITCIPSAFVPLDSLPLTPHGKLDRTAPLPAPGLPESESDNEHVAPRNAVEATIAQVWSSVLGRERVGATDHFFDLGGHSLLATQVVSRLRDALGFEIPLRLLFEGRRSSPTWPSASGRLRYRDSSRLPRFRPSSREGDLPLSYAQESLWYLEQLAPGRPTFNVTAAVRVSGPLDVAALQRGLDEVACRHEALRTTFLGREGRPIQVIASSLSVPIIIRDMTGERDPALEAERVAAEEIRLPFDLERGPLIRVTLFGLSEADHAVLLTMHHIITDGWSFGVAAAELATLYDAYRLGLPSPLPEPTLQYADYAVWQREWLSGPARERLLSYWRSQLADLRPLELPTDRPHPAVRSGRGASRSFSLPSGLSSSPLEALGRREETTLFMTLLAAFQVLLHRTSGQTSFAVGSPIANRNRVEIEGMIGYFVNMLALRADLAGDPTFRELLGRVRETSLGAYQHQDLPLEVLVADLQPERDPSRTPLFQVMFVLQNNRMPEVPLGDLTLDTFGDIAETGTAKFDLTLAMTDTPDGLAGSIEYSTDLFDPETIEGLIDRFRTLLADVTSDPDCPVSRLCVATGGDLDRINEWNATETLVPAGGYLHHLFESQVCRSPDAIAAEFGGQAALLSRTGRSARIALRLPAPVARHRSAGGTGRAGPAPLARSAARRPARRA